MSTGDPMDYTQAMADFLAYHQGLQQAAVVPTYTLGEDLKAYDALELRITKLEEVLAAVVMALGLKGKDDVTTGGDVSSVEVPMPGK